MFQYPTSVAVQVSLELFFISKNRHKNSYSYSTSHISEDQKWISSILNAKKFPSYLKILTTTFFITYDYLKQNNYVIII